MTKRTGELAEHIITHAGAAKRFLVAIAGPPGSGKSTLAEEIAGELAARGESAAVVPMDGFHMDNAVLEEKRLLERKGAPQTFDIRGLLDILKALHQGDEEVLVPLFDRARELSIAAARAVPVHTRFILIEGNYLLLDEPGWMDLAEAIDLSVMLAPPENVLEERLLRRWLDLSLAPDTAREKVVQNDLPNGRLVRTRSRKADVTLC